MIFVDSNIPMYVAGTDHPLRGPALRFMARVRNGDLEVCTSTEVLQEILYRYVGLRRLDLATAVYDSFVQLCPVVLPVALPDTDRAREILQGSDGISVRDAIHAAVMLNNDVEQIATFDEGFDRVTGIARVTLA
ncbi:type II toxin-antitoxin system VapC family toxin [soil metagenome]